MEDDRSTAVASSSSRTSTRSTGAASGSSTQNDTSIHHDRRTARSLIGQWPIELLELVMMRSFLLLFENIYETVPHRAAQRAYQTLARTSSEWRQTLVGWPQSNTRNWLRHKIRFRVKEFKPVRPESCCLEKGKFAKSFSFVKHLGTGAKGTVYKVSHLGDHKEYAIKEIRIDNEMCAYIMQMLKHPNSPQKEVFRLVRLGFHPNIVRYHTSWIEEESVGLQTVDNDSVSSRSRPSGKEFIAVVSPEHVQIVSGHDRSNGPGPESLPSGKAFNIGASPEPLQRASGQGVSHQLSDLEVPALSPALSLQSSTISYYLYIQLELCETTLYDWIKARNKFMENPRSEPKYRQLRDWVISAENIDMKESFKYVSDKPANKCLEDILRGLNYMHSKQLAHGDLHHGNILIHIDERGHVTAKLSDFGSAKTLENVERQVHSFKVSVCESQCSIISHPYSELKECKNDLWRLASTIGNLYFPRYRHSLNIVEITSFVSHASFTQFEQQFPLQAEWISRLTDADPAKRPNAADMLHQGKKDGSKIFIGSHIEAEVFRAKEEENKILTERTQELEENLVDREKVIQDKDKQIEELQRQIDMLKRRRLE